MKNPVAKFSRLVNRSGGVHNKDSKQTRHKRDRRNIKSELKLNVGSDFYCSPFGLKLNTSQSFIITIKRLRE